MIDLRMKGRWIFGAEGRARDFFFLGYDPLANHWVMLQLDNSPNYALLIAPQGWQNGTITFVGDAAFTSGRQYLKRAIISRAGSGSFKLSDDQQTPDGSYVPLDRYDFTRTR